ncbi:MAG: hypothetical protein KC766_04400 [Myxococcales bacterium]|nr:hypothetical protein [Myxococcales bacterium]
MGFLSAAPRLMRAMGEPHQSEVMAYLCASEPLAKAAKVIKTGPRGGKITGHRADGSPIYARNSSGARKAKPAADPKPHPLESAHNALKAAAAAHVANPTEQTAKALDDAHAALRSAASAHTQPNDKPSDKPGEAQGSKAKGEKQDKPSHSATAAKPTPVDSEPLAPGEGETPNEAAVGEPVSPETPAGAGRSAADKMQADVAALHEKLVSVEHAISGELVPLYNALKSDMRRLYKRPQQAPISFLGKRVEAFVAMVTKVLKAGVSLATRMAKSQRMDRYLARSGAAPQQLDREPLTRSARVFGFDAVLESQAFDLLEEMVAQAPALIAREARVERLATMRAAMVKSCRYIPTASPLHQGEVPLPGGLVAMVEVPAGEHRSGVGEDGRAWSSLMPVHYGELEGTLGRDGDPIDVFLGPMALDAGPVWLVDVYDAQGRRAEDKAFIGFSDEDDVEAIIDFVYQPVRARVGEPRKMAWGDFTAWCGRRPMLEKADRLSAVERELDEVLGPARGVQAVEDLLRALDEL